VLCSCVEGFGVELPGGKAPHPGRVLALESPGARRGAGTRKPAASPAASDSAGGTGVRQVGGPSACPP